MVEIYTVKTKITDYYFIMKETSRGIAVCRVNKKMGAVACLQQPLFSSIESVSKYIVYFTWKDWLSSTASLRCRRRRR